MSPFCCPSAQPKPAPGSAGWKPCPREVLHGRTEEHPSRVTEVYRSCPGQGDGFNDLPKSLPLLRSYGKGILTQRSPQGSRYSLSIPTDIDAIDGLSMCARLEY